MLAALLLLGPAAAVLQIRAARPDELLRVARFRAAAFAENGEATPARAQAVHRLVEDRSARGSTMLCALATGGDAPPGGEPDVGEAGWHPGLSAPGPLGFLQAAFRSEPGATLDQRLEVEDGAAARLVGACDVSRHEFDLPTHSLAPDYGLYLTALAVHPACRRRGVASSLLDAADAAARAEGLDRVVLHVERDNAGALAFYEAAAFDAVAVDRDLRQFATALGLNPELHTLYTRRLRAE